MQTFEYEGCGQDNQPVKGFVDGPGITQAEEQLLGQGIRVTTIAPVGRQTRGAWSRGGLKPAEIVSISEHLGTIVNNNMPLAPSVALLAADAQSGRVRRILGNVQRTLESGGTLAEGLAEGGAALPAAVLCLVRVGEQTGNLPAVLAQVAKHYGRLADARNAILLAAAYPAFLVFAACLLLSMMFSIVIPQFAIVYATYGGTLPAATRLVLSMNDMALVLFNRDTLVLWAAAVAILILVRLYFGVNSRGKMVSMRFTEFLRYHLPVFGALYRAALAERFARMLGMLITNQAQAPDSIALAGVASGSLRMAEAAQKAAMLAKNGSQLSEALAAMHEFRTSFLWIVGNAENQGELGYTLLRLADAYEREVDRRATSIVAFAEPIGVTVVGVIIAALVISMFMPILQLSSLVG